MMWVGISLRFLWLTEHMALTATDRLAGINAFAAFAAREDFASGVPPRVLQRMLRGLSVTPEKVLADFYNLCGAPVTVATPCVPNLRTGLDDLQKGDVRPILASRAGQCSVLAARHDPVVSSSMTQDSFAGRATVLWEDGGHMLPQTHVQTCVAFLQAVRSSMEQDAR